VPCRWEEVDGIPALVAQEGLIQGPLQAGLAFGVGRSDEEMRVSGVNHLIEHLALQPFGQTAYPWNGQVRPVSTQFVVMGTPEQVALHLSGLARNITSLPLDRLANEAQVLRVEDSGRGASQVGFDLSTRFGPRGVGLLGWPEHGLRRLDPDEVQAWARRWFIRQNAVLWCSGALPQGLDLRCIADGPAPTRNPPSISSPKPRSWIGAQTRTISASLVTGPEDWDAFTAMEIARGRAFEQLRLEAGVSYNVEFVHTRLGGGYGHEYLAADSAEGAEAQVFTGLVSALDSLAQSGPSQDEMDTMHQRREALAGHPQMLLGDMDSIAERRVLHYVPARRLFGKV